MCTVRSAVQLKWHPWKVIHMALTAPTVLLCEAGVDDSEHDVMAEEISILSLLYVN